jgi:hypothetical protein
MYTYCAVFMSKNDPITAPTNPQYAERIHRKTARRGADDIVPS